MSETKVVWIGWEDLQGLAPQGGGTARLVVGHCKTGSVHGQLLVLSHLGFFFPPHRQMGDGRWELAGGW